MQPNDYLQPANSGNAAPGQPGTPPQFSPQAVPQTPVTPGGPVPASYSPELAAQLTGRPIVPAQPGVPTPQSQAYTAQGRNSSAAPYTPPAQAPVPQYYAAQQPATAVMQGQYAAAPQGAPMAAPNRKSPARFVALLAVSILVLAVAAAGFVYLRSHHSRAADSSSANRSAQKAVAASGATGDLAKLKSFSLVAPADNQMTGLMSMGTDTTTHLNQYMNGDKSCTFSFGTIPAGVGTAGDVGAVAAAALAGVKKIDPNIQVTGPNKVDALKLKADDGKTYALPTVNYAFTDTTEGGGTLVETYATYQLADMSHATVAMFCKSDTPNQQSALSAKVTALQPVAQKITIKTK